MSMCTAIVTLPDGTTRTYPRHGTTAGFVVYGRDAIAVRNNEPPGVAEWCANEPGAQNVLPYWKKFGGEWSVLPVTYRP